jgi:nucleoside triphosphate diphosphatase
MTAESQTRRLLDIMAALRDRESGCPWDQVQSFETIAPYTIEEAYEVADAIARRDYAALPDELGDLLLQVVYHSRLAEEAGLFSYESVIRLISDKMVHRHPHVFGDGILRQGAWEDSKEAERRDRAQSGALAGVPGNLPALTRSAKLSARAARVGFDWPEVNQALDKLDEEIAEFREELPGADLARLADELGDVLFTVANVARKLGLDPEACLRQANEKFRRRFEAMERQAEHTGMSLRESTLDDLETAWQQVKRAE